MNVTAADGFSERADRCWGEAAYWDGRYREMIAKGHGYWATWAAARGVQATVARFAAWPLMRVLDAGCGDSMVPDLLKFWGFDVTAIDLSAAAIASANARQPSESDLTRCLFSLARQRADSRRFDPHAIETETVWLLDVLRRRARDGGCLRRFVADWRSPALPAFAFDWVRVSNGFARATREFAVDAAHAFRRLLRPGGLLLVEQVNAFHIRGGLLDSCGGPLAEVLAEAGFSLLPGDWGTGDPAYDQWPETPAVPDPSKRYAVCLWHSG